jgi:hypothetical protein
MAARGSGVSPCTWTCNRSTVAAHNLHAFRVATRFHRCGACIVADRLLPGAGARTAAGVEFAALSRQFWASGRSEASTAGGLDPRLPNADRWGQWCSRTAVRRCARSRDWPDRPATMAAREAVSGRSAAAFERFVRRPKPTRSRRWPSPASGHDSTIRLRIRSCHAPRIKGSQLRNVPFTRFAPGIGARRE